MSYSSWVSCRMICSPVSSTQSPLFAGCHQNAVVPKRMHVARQSVTLPLEFDPVHRRFVVKAQKHYICREMPHRLFVLLPKEGSQKVGLLTNFQTSYSDSRCL